MTQLRNENMLSLTVSNFPFSVFTSLRMHEKLKIVHFLVEKSKISSCYCSDAKQSGFPWGLKMNWTSQKWKYAFSDNHGQNLVDKFTKLSEIQMDTSLSICHPLDLEIPHQNLVNISSIMNGESTSDHWHRFDVDNSTFIRLSIPMKFEVFHVFFRCRYDVEST